MPTANIELHYFHQQGAVLKFNYYHLVWKIGQKKVDSETTALKQTKVIQTPLKLYSKGVSFSSNTPPNLLILYWYVSIYSPSTAPSIRMSFKGDSVPSRLIQRWPKSFLAKSSCRAKICCGSSISYKKLFSQRISRSLFQVKTKIYLYNLVLSIGRFC